MDILVQTVGTLGLVETWVLIVYGFGSLGRFTMFEDMIFKFLARFEAAGYAVMLLSWHRILCAERSEGTRSVERHDNFKTVSRDVLHNLVHPRSEPGSRMRREYAVLAWGGVLISGLPVLVMVPLYPVLVWGSHADTPSYALVIPSVLGVVAIVEAVVGWTYLETNRSSYVVTVLHLNTKLLSLIYLVNGYDHLLVGSGWDGSFPGMLLGVLQVVKIASAVVAVGDYLRGKPDEDMPKLKALCCSCHA